MSHRPDPSPTGPPPAVARTARFGEFQLDLASGELRREGRLVPLRPQATRVLLLLVRNPGRLVLREELRRELWGGTAVAWSTGIHQAIRQIRAALDDGERHLVETVPRRGYRFRAALEPRGSAPQSRPAPPWYRGRNAGFLVAGAATPVLVAAALVIACALLAD